MSERAIQKADFEDMLIPWEKIRSEVQDDDRVYARAAIEAMREPTEAMEQAGFYAGPCEIVPPLPYTGPDSTVMAPLVWRAMIDKALK